MDKLLTAEEWRINNCIMAEWTDENVEQYANYKAEYLLNQFKKSLYKEIDKGMGIYFHVSIDNLHEQILKQLK